jgi:hypothetical protein
VSRCACQVLALYAKVVETHLVAAKQYLLTYPVKKPVA